MFIELNEHVNCQNTLIEQSKLVCILVGFSLLNSLHGETL